VTVAAVEHQISEAARLKFSLIAVSTDQQVGRSPDVEVRNHQPD
jgi:hypothetical protein